MGIRGVTVSDVRGFGAQGGSTERHGGILPYLYSCLHCALLLKVETILCMLYCQVLSYMLLYLLIECCILSMKHTSLFSQGLNK